MIQDFEKYIQREILREFPAKHSSWAIFQTEFPTILTLKLYIVNWKYSLDSYGTVLFVNI